MTENPAAATLVAPEEIAFGTGRTRRFQGMDHGAGVSYFSIDYAPGRGTGLHWHPYAETWIVLEGEATFTVGGASIRGTAGDTVTGPPCMPHRFENSGSGPLRVIGIHASPVIIQTDLD